VNRVNHLLVLWHLYALREPCPSLVGTLTPLCTSWTVSIICWYCDTSMSFVNRVNHLMVMWHLYVLREPCQSFDGTVTPLCPSWTVSIICWINIMSVSSRVVFNLVHGNTLVYLSWNISFANYIQLYIWLTNLYISQNNSTDVNVLRDKNKLCIV